MCGPAVAPYGLVHDRQTTGHAGRFEISGKYPGQSAPVRSRGTVNRWSGPSVPRVPAMCEARWRRDVTVKGRDARRLGACHWMLLRLAGTASDDLLTQCRHWLAEGRVLDVGRAAAHAVVSHRLRL